MIENIVGGDFMSFNRFAPVLLAFAIALSASGCSARQSPKTTPQGYTITPNQMVKSVGNKVLPPKQLNVIHSNALGIMTDAEKKDWAAAQSKMSQIRTNYNQLRPLMQASSVPANRMNSLGKAISGLDKQITAKNAYETRVEANRLTKALPDITETYKTTVPANLGRLGYLSREISLNIEKNDWRNAGINYNSARTMWTGMNRQLGINANPGTANFSSSLQGLGKAIASKSAAGAKVGAKGLSDALTSLESYFTNMAKPK
jgi:hypothetical protein